MAPRAIVLVIDGCGAGAAPDCTSFGDSPACNTLSNTASAVGPLALPNFARLGLGNITNMLGVPKEDHAQGFFGKLQEMSNGKDTQTGHWELMGVINSQAFPTYPHGFPAEIIEPFIKETGCGGILCNMPASGTEVLKVYGQEHERTGYPIVYTSADSVFQIACHIERIKLNTLYQWCETARAILQGPHRMGRVIARPFTGQNGVYTRLQGERRDYAVPPPVPTFLDYLQKSGLGVLGIGKIEDIFTGCGLSHAKHTASNQEGLALTLASIQRKIDLNPLKLHSEAASSAQLIFTNLVDTDSMFGHRRDVQGYAGALIEIDQWLGKIIAALEPEDLLLITSDHGNDPTMPGTDHTREDVPLLLYSPSLTTSNSRKNLGVRSSFADVAATLAAWLRVGWTKQAGGIGQDCLGS